MSFGFVQQLMLIGLAGVALPVLAHLLSKRKFDIVFWGAMQFLELGRRTRRRIRLEELLLLLLRIGLISLLALAFARPWGKGGVFSAITDTVRRDVVFVVDGSYSMGWQGGGATPHAAARQWIHRAVGELRPGDTYSLLEARDQVIPVIEDPTSDPRVIREQVDEIPPPAGTSRLAAASTKAVQLLSRTTNPIREVIILTDDQAYPWSVGDAPLWARFDDLRSQQTIQPRIWSVNLLGDVPGDRNNFSVDRIQLSRPTTVPNFPVRIRTVIRQSGGKPATRAVHLSVNGQRLQDQTTIVNVPPNGEAPVDFEHRFPTAGSYLVTVAIEPDLLPGDNEAHAAVTVTTGVPVLLVDGRPHSDPVLSKAFFARAALTAQANESPWVQATTIPASELNAKSLDGKDVVLLLDVLSLTDAQLKAVTEYVQAGGGLVIAPGELAKADFYNGPLVGKGLGLSPGELVSVSGETDAGGGPVLLDGDSFEVPWMSRFKPGSGIDLATIRFSKWWKLRLATVAPAPNPAPADPAAPPPAPAKEQTEPTVIAGKFKSGDLWILTRRFGEGHVAILAAPLDTTWSTLPSKNDFVPFLHELVFSFVSRNEGRNVESGMPLELPLPAGVDPTAIEFVLPDGKTAPGQPSGDDKHPTARLDVAVSPGVYRAVRKSRPQEAPEYFVVEFDRQEANLTPLSEPELKTLASTDRIRPIRKLDEWTAAVAADAPRTELWWMILVAVLALLVFEVAMTRRLVRSGHEFIDPELEAEISAQPGA